MSAKLTLRVFEHERLAVGRSLPQADGSTAVFEQRHFDALARFSERTGLRYFQLGHNSVRFRQYVGMLQIGRLSIEVLPKIDRTAPEHSGSASWRAALLDMIRVATRVRLHAPSHAPLALERRSLLDIYVQLFLTELTQLCRQGFAKRYREVESNLCVFRGRLCASTHARINAAHRERFYVAHPVYDHDHLLNAILAEALRVVEAMPLSPSTRAQAKRLSLTMPELPSRTILAQDFEQLSYSRNTRRYEACIRLARLLLLGYSPDLRWGREHVLALLFDMNRLWELFICDALAHALGPAFELRKQDKRAFWSTAAERPRTIRPDLVIRERSSSRCIVLDTKWKLVGARGPSIADLRQMFTYNQYFGATESILLYPRAGAAHTTFGHFHDHEHGCRVATLSVVDTQGFSRGRIHEQLRALIDQVQPQRRSAPSPG